MAASRPGPAHVPGTEVSTRSEELASDADGLAGHDGSEQAVRMRPRLAKMGGDPSLAGWIEFDRTNVQAGERLAVAKLIVGRDGGDMRKVSRPWTFPVWESGALVSC